MIISNHHQYTLSSLQTYLEQGFMAYFHESRKNELPLRFAEEQGIIQVYSSALAAHKLVSILISAEHVTFTKHAEHDVLYNLDMMIEALDDYISNPPIDNFI